LAPKLDVPLTLNITGLVLCPIVPLRSKLPVIVKFVVLLIAASIVVV